MIKIMILWIVSIIIVSKIVRISQDFSAWILEFISLSIVDGWWSMSQRGGTDCVVKSKNDGEVEGNLCLSEANHVFLCVLSFSVYRQ